MIPLGHKVLLSFVEKIWSALILASTNGQAGGRVHDPYCHGSDTETSSSVSGVLCCSRMMFDCVLHV